MGLTNKHIFITGASGGLGIQVARQFMALGSTVSLHYNSNKDALIALHGPITHLVRADISNEHEVMLAIESSVNKFGPIDILIVLHGIWPLDDVPIHEMTLERWQKTINVNLDGTFLIIKHYLRQLQSNMKHFKIEAPSIVLVGLYRTYLRSTAGKFGEAWHADYSCSKSAMMYGLTLSLKNEIVRIHPRARINTVSPGIFFVSKVGLERPWLSEQ